MFLEISKRVEITEHRAEGRVTYRLKGAGVPDRVNRMPLVTAWFPTAIDRVQLVPAGPDADLVIELKRPSESAYRVIDTPRGIVLQVDFPPLPGNRRRASAAAGRRARLDVDAAARRRSVLSARG